MVVDYSGSPVSGAERTMALLTAIRYLREEKSGEVRFRCLGFEGHIESEGRKVLGSHVGTVFRMDLEALRVTFFVESLIERHNIPTDAVVFLARRRVYAEGKKHALN